MNFLTWDLVEKLFKRKDLDLNHLVRPRAYAAEIDAAYGGS